jgi:hypothetical protein
VFAGWIFFRARSLEPFLTNASALCSFDLPVWWKTYVLSLLLLSIPVVLMHSWQYSLRQNETVMPVSRFRRACLQGAMLITVIAWWKQEPASFIYFQF